MAEQTSEYLYERGFLNGRRQAFPEGELAGARKLLYRRLIKRFGPLSNEMIERIEAVSNFEKLDQCLDQIPIIQSPEELQL